MDRSEFPEHLEDQGHWAELLDHQVWTEGGLILTAMMHDLNQVKGYFLIPVGYNGYVRFPQEVIPVEGRLKDYVHARGGITYAELSADGSAVYGFDTKHFHDEGDPDIANLDFITGEIRAMARALALAIPFSAALARIGGLDGWMDEWSDEQRQIINVYDEQEQILLAEPDLRAPLPDDFWQRCAWHPSLHNPNPQPST